MKREIILAAVFVAMSSVGAAMAQQQPMGSNAEVALASGDYRDLNWFRKFKLAAASFVNPTLLETADIAYRYDLSDITETVSAAALIAAVNNGMVGFAEQQAGEDVYALKPVQELSPETKKVLEAFMSEAYQDKKIEGLELLDIHLVAKDSKLFGKISDSPIVTWHAMQPIVPRGPKNGPEETFSEKS